MRNAFFRFVLVLAATLATLPALAQTQYNQWVISEIFSTRDGKIQFIELEALGSFQDDLLGQVIRGYDGGYTRDYVFPYNLPSDSAGHKVLLGTQGFADLHIVTPDYIIPDGLVFPFFGGAILFGAYDSFYHPEIPEPPLSMYRDGTPGMNTPTNFAGHTATVPAFAPPFNVQGLYWNAPANTESGWGINIAHQGDTLFATWFTYDVDGSQMWLVIPNMKRISPRFYSGDVYRTTGPAYNVATWDPTAVGVTSFGTGTFRFSSESEAVFEHTFGVNIVTKNIIRQVFSSPVPVCAPNGSAGSTPVYQDLWWRSGGTESGWGLNIAHQGNIVFVTWFTYDADGKGMWVVMPRGERVGTTQSFTGPLYRTLGPPYDAAFWDPSLVVVTEFGSGTLSFTGINAGTFTYTVGSTTQSKPIMRQAFATPATVCRFP